LQAIVDTLARRLDRAVALDDRTSRLLAYSSHAGSVDDVRKESILSRRAPEKAWAWASKFDIESAAGPVRIKGNARLKMDARVCVPIRAQENLLGYLWLIDPGLTLTDEDLDVATAAAADAGAVLYREQLVGELELGRERELLRDLVAEEAALREHAASELVENELFAACDRVVVLVVRPVPLDGGPLDDRVRTSIGGALEKVRRVLSPRRRLQLIRPDHGLSCCRPCRAPARVGMSSSASATNSRRSEARPRATSKHRKPFASRRSCPGSARSRRGRSSGSTACCRASRSSNCGAKRCHPA
jgi:hypothetical protein